MHELASGKKLKKLVGVCVCIYIYIYICVCVCVWVGREFDRYVFTEI